MAAGRPGAAWTITRFGNRRTLLGAGLLTAGGLAELLGLRVALGTIAAAGLLIFTLALRLRAS